MQHRQVHVDRVGAKRAGWRRVRDDIACRIPVVDPTPRKVGPYRVQLDQIRGQNGLRFGCCGSQADLCRRNNANVVRDANAQRTGKHVGACRLHGEPHRVAARKRVASRQRDNVGSRGDALQVVGRLVRRVYLTHVSQRFAILVQPDVADAKFDCVGIG